MINDIEMELSAEEKIATLQHERDVAVWLYMEILYKLQLAALQQAMKDPRMQEQLASELMKRIVAG